MRLGVRDALYLFIIFLLIAQLYVTSHENGKLKREQESIKENLITSQLTHEIFEVRHHAKLVKRLMGSHQNNESKLALLIELNNTKYSLSKLEMDAEYLGTWLGYKNDILLPSGGDCVELLDVVYSSIQSGNMTNKDILLASKGIDAIINFTYVYPPTYENIIKGLNEMNSKCRELLLDADKT
ncbi:hypothetical protein [Palaeococcus ferrophilus]|uniref:hypothetical protein n=1 Tax=Palaeococcus ferrophilus TaxID=83868 RepID=UPI00064E5554|nr:hypothetical protein [Palaeococcus ferrophilus]